MAKAPVRRLTARRTASSRGIAVKARRLRRRGAPGLVASLAAVDLVFDEVGDDLGVGLGDELVALGDEGGFEGEVVFDDAVVDDDEGAGAVAVGVGVLFGGAAVGGPAGVADAEGAVDGAVGDDGFEVAELAGGAAEFEAGGVAGYGDAGGVVAAVLEAAQAFNDDGDDGLRTNVTDDSTHGMSLVGVWGFCAKWMWDFWGRWLTGSVFGGWIC